MLLNNIIQTNTVIMHNKNVELVLYIIIIILIIIFFILASTVKIDYAWPFDDLIPALVLLILSPYIIL